VRTSKVGQTFISSIAQIEHRPRFFHHHNKMSYTVSGILNSSQISSAGVAQGLATLDETANVPVVQLGNVGSTTAVSDNTTNIAAINASKGVASGIATLDTTANVPVVQLGNVGSTTAVSDNTTNIAAINASKGAASGIATLDSTSNVPAAQLGNVASLSVITTLQSDETTNASNITTLQTDVSTLQTDVSTLQTDVSTLQTDESTNAANITTLQTDVSTLQTDVSTLQTDETTNASAISAINAKIGADSGIATLTSGGVLTPSQIPPYVGYNVTPAVTITGTASDSVIGAYSIPAVDANFVIKVYIQSQGSTDGDFAAWQVFVLFTQASGTPTALVTSGTSSPVAASSTYATDIGGSFSVSVTTGTPSTLNFLASQSVSGGIANWMVYYQVYECPIPPVPQ